MKQIKAVIFDMDGVLVDTERISRRAWDAVGDKWGCRIDETFLSKLRGSNLAQVKSAFLSEFGEKLEFDTIWEEKRQLFLQALEEDGVPVKKGAVRLLQYLKEKGYGIALATGSGRSQTTWNLQKAGLENWFDIIVCGDEVARSKPDPEIFLKAAEELGVRSEQCLVLEDSLNGISAAVNGGFHAVMLPDLTMPDAETRRRVDAVLDDLTEVIIFLEKDRAG